MLRILPFPLVIAISLLSITQGNAGDEAKPIRITYHGHSFFVVTSSKGTKIAFDPHMVEAYGRIMGVKADAILMSHNHLDHNQARAIENYRDKNVKKILGLKGSGFRATWNIVDTKVKDVRIKSVGAYHDESEGMENSKNTIFIIEVDGWRIAHLGDLGHTLNKRQLKQIGKIDVLMIPVGGIYTLNGADAKRVVEQLKPREYIFPMHYGTDVFDEVLTPAEFLEDQPRRRVTSSPTNSLILNTDARRPRPLIVLLHYREKK